MEWIFLHVGSGPLKSMPKSKGKSEKLSHSVWLPHSAADFGDVFHFRGGGGGGFATPDSAGSCGQGRAWQIDEEKRGGGGREREEF